MAKKMIPAKDETVALVCAGLKFLTMARDRFKAAGCPNTLARVRSAVKSGEGALRHVMHRRRRTEEGAL